MSDLSVEEKAKRYDEIQTWWWWIQRRRMWRSDRKVSHIHMMTFLNGLAANLEEYKEDER